MREIIKLRKKNKQIKALKKLGFEFIILGKLKKRLYAFERIDYVDFLLKEYATFNGIALNSDRFGNLEELKPDCWYKI